MKTDNPIEYLTSLGEKLMTLRIIYKNGHKASYLFQSSIELTEILTQIEVISETEPDKDVPVRTINLDKSEIQLIEISPA